MIIVIVMIMAMFVVMVKIMIMIETMITIINYDYKQCLKQFSSFLSQIRPLNANLSVRNFLIII